MVFLSQTSTQLSTRCCVTGIDQTDAGLAHSVSDVISTAFGFLIIRDTHPSLG